MTKPPAVRNDLDREFMWVSLDGVRKSAIVHGSSAKTPQEIYAALMEQLFKVLGADAVASFLAECLRFPAPHPDVIATVARSLDPQTDDYMKLVLEGRRRGKRITKRVNDAAIVQAVKKHMEALGNKHGDQKKAVKKTADEFGIKQPTVRKALRSK
jgi:hypothetical protein